MTLTQFILIVFALFAIVCGLYIIIGGNKNKKLSEKPAQTAIANDKNGLPILARHERPAADNMTFKSEITADNPTGSVVLSGENTQLDLPNNLFVTAQTEDDFPPVPPVVMTYAAKPEPYEMPAEGDDVLGALASATETITPVVHTFDEIQLKTEGFNNVSPILDTHIQSQIDQEQDSPLNNAVQNINISIFPNQQFARINGRDLLQLVDKYGMKYGAMNMFHRYEHKDGTGLLWFSMMMITEDGILPFDLNNLPNQSMKGLVLFLSLPHPKAVQGFDSMMSVAGLLAHDLNATVFDETGEPINKENTQLMREIAIQFGKS